MGNITSDTHEILPNLEAMDDTSGMNGAQRSNANIDIPEMNVSQKNDTDITWGSTRSGLSWRQFKSREGVG